MLQEGDVLQEEVEKRDDGLTYYSWWVTEQTILSHICSCELVQTQ